MTLRTSSIDALPREAVLLAPCVSDVKRCFQEIDTDPYRHQRLLHEVQKFRGKMYLADGAIRASDLKPDGRHVQPIDYDSWHIVGLDEHGGVCGCLRYRRHAEPSYRELGVSQSALAANVEWGGVLRNAVEQELTTARVEDVAYVEVGGWAIAPERRCTATALRMALSTYAVAQALGGARGITTATVRHHSSTILRRIGGAPLEFDGMELPSYFDPRYGCQIEILRFDSGAPSESYRQWVGQLRARLHVVPVVCGRRSIADVELLRRGAWRASGRANGAMAALRASPSLECSLT
jgi:hypothetical protein